MNILDTNLYRDQSIDPGPIQHHPGNIGAVANLRLAVASGELTELPGKVLRALAAEDAAQRLNIEHATTAHTGGVQNFVRDLHAHVVDGTTDLPDYETFAAQALDAAHREQLATTASTAGEAFVRWSKHQVPFIFQEMEDEILDGLRAQLTEVMTATRKAAAALGSIDTNDAMQVATATDAQRKAITTLVDLSRRYNRLRMLQVSTYAASNREAPGATPHMETNWKGALDSGVHEVGGITYGDHGPARDLPPVQRMLQLAKRDDVWLPTYEQMNRRLAELRGPVAPLHLR